MSLRQKRRQRVQETPELDVTPFMNLMIVLVPVLLLSMVFVHTTVIELNFPAAKGGGAADPDLVHLEVQIRDDVLVVADGRSEIKRLPRTDTGQHDFAGLADVMREIKRRLPEKRDATILLEPDTEYQTLVFVMDSMRVHRVLVGGEYVSAELFPDLSLGDVPDAS